LLVQVAPVSLDRREYPIHLSQQVGGLVRDETGNYRHVVHDQIVLAAVAVVESIENCSGD
jgi:hypothetical protein